MSYLRFDKSQMANLEESLQREILRTNRSGAYSCSTIVGCNTRKYHGLLVIPIPTLDDDNHVLLSSLDETIVEHGSEFNLGVHKYYGDNYSPKGHKYIKEFVCDTTPTAIYRVGDVLLKKEKLFVHHENRILIRYTLLESFSGIELRLRPFLAFRNVRNFTHENYTASRDYRDVENGIATCMYAGYPELFMQINCKNEFKYAPDWYRGIYYSKEQERGYDFNEDLYVPGYFSVRMKKGDIIVFSAGISEIKTNPLKKLFDSEQSKREPRDSFSSCLRNSSHQFLKKQGDNYYLLAGYPWFKPRARDTFIALPGLTLSIGEVDRFEQIMSTATIALEDFIAGRELSVKIKEFNKPDILLWAIWCIQQYAKATTAEQCEKKYGKLLEQVINFICSNSHSNLTLHENGMLYTDGRKEAVTWMNAMVNGVPVTPRTGYIVEINALWYNALRFAASLWHKGDKKRIMNLNEIAEKCQRSFRETFINEHGYLFDYVDGNTRDYSVRPNMIFAIALEYSPLERHEKKSVLDFCTRELLTPKGLRSLSPRSTGYTPMYVGPQSQRDYAYHQGTAWPWLGGFYFEAYLNIYKRSGLSLVERYLINFEDELSTHCISTIPELFDGNPPFQGRGAISFAMNVAGIQRTLKLVEEMNNEN